MPSLASMLGYAALWGAVRASPINLLEDLLEPVNESLESFSVQMIEQEGVPRHGALAVERTYRKYGVSPPSDVVTAVASLKEDGSVSASAGNQVKSYYVSPVTIGCTEVMLNFDTGSSDLWVFSDLLPASDQENHTVWDPTTSCADSTASLKANYTWSIGYSDGSGAAGIVYADKVAVGGATVTSQAVEAATSVSPSFQKETSADGLLGLAFGSVNMVSPTKQATFFENVKSSLKQPLFTAALSQGSGGTYDFGYIDGGKFTGSLVYTKVDNSSGYWGFTMEGFAVGNYTIKADVSPIVDTGTSLIYMPSAVAREYYARVDGAAYNAQAGGYIYPCDTELPAFGVVVQGQLFSVPGDHLNYSAVGSGYCFGGVQDGVSLGLSILGDMFLRAMFVVFADTSAGPILGFAAQKGTDAVARAVKYS